MGMRRRRPGPPPAPRTAGQSRRDRRALDRGGEGVAGELNRIVGGWDGVRVTPMFGRFGYFSGDQLFGCFPIRGRSHDLWIRLSTSDQARALARQEVRPHRRFAGRGWVELDVVGPESVGVALRWLRRAHQYVRMARPVDPGTPDG